MMPRACTNRRMAGPGVPVATFVVAAFVASGCGVPDAEQSPAGNSTEKPTAAPDGGSAPTTVPPSDPTSTPEPNPPSPSEPATRRGFVEVSELRYRLSPSTDPSDSAPNDQPGELDFSAPAARLFYQYAGATNAEADSRLCIAFNGGPGASSVGLWLSLGPRASAPLNQLCRTLFIDARNTGLSYELVADPTTHEPSFEEYNAYVDAADVLRALPGLDDPSLVGGTAQIVLVGESYAGVRTTLMLDMIHETASYTNGSRPLQSSQLVAELDQLQTIWGTSPRDVFTHQILIQPTIAGRLQDEVTGRLMQQLESPLRQLAQALDAPLPACDADSCNGFQWMIRSLQTLGRSPYDTRQPSEWLDEQFAEARRYVDSTLLEQLGSDPPPGLRPADRTSAFRTTLASPPAPDSEEWPERFGPLPEIDRYFVGFNDEVFEHFTSSDARAFAVDAFHPSYAERFVRLTTEVHTFVTRAQFDFVNYWLGLQGALESLPEVVQFELDQTGDEPRPGAWLLTLDDDSRARIRTPAYAASHSVAHDAGDELLSDLQAWLTQTNADDRP